MALLCPVCKWEVFRSLEEHISQRHPSIKIDNHVFQLIFKNLSESYLLIKIKNVNLNFTFIVYRSNSHGGIFRLCTRTDESGHLYKGNTNYTTQTFIHIELQKFIIEKSGDLLVDDTINTRSCPLYNSNIREEDPKIKYNALIDNILYERRYKNEVLDKLVGINCGSGFLSVEKMIENILEMHNLPSIYTQLQKNIMRVLNPSFNVDTISRRPSHSPLLVEYKRIKPDVAIRKRIIRTYLEYISAYLNSEFFVLRESNRHLYRDVFNIPKIDGVEIQMTYYSVVIQNKEDASKFTVIYAIYNIVSPGHRELNGRFSIVFNITPVVNKMEGASALNINCINRVGLYRYYVSMGIYLCKIFDYVEQVRTIADRSYGGYLFLGDLYTNLFPVNKLYNPDLTPI
jgi:hypothetical protein